MATSFPLQYHRLDKRPLTDQETFVTMEELEFYLLHDAPFPGQIVTVQNVSGFTSPQAYVIGDNNTLYPITSGGGGGSAVLTEDLLFETSVGGIPIGRLFSKDTPLESLWRVAASNIVYPTYSKPSLTITTSPSGQVEYGSNVETLIVPTWQQRDAGNINAYKVYKDGQLISSMVSAGNFTDEPFILLDSVIYSATAEYGQGPIKNDSTGQPYEYGRIENGIAEATTTITPVRYGFYGSDNSTTIPENSAQIRFFNGTIVSPHNGSVFNINIQPGARRVVIAYPSNLMDITTIKYVEQGNAEYKDLFTKTEINVEGNTGSLAVPYKVFYWIIPSPPSAAMTFTCQI